MKHAPCDPGDYEIIHQVIAGNVNAFEQLLRKYQNYVLKIIKRHIPHDEVKDITQDVFFRAYQSLRTFKGNSGFEQWLSTIAVRTCYDFWRKHYESRELSMSALKQEQRDWLEQALSDKSSRSFLERGLRNEDREILDWALERLPAEDRMVLELVYLEDRSVKEAARLLGWTAANVKVRSFRSRRKLHKLLNKQMGCKTWIDKNRRSGT